MPQEDLALLPQHIIYQDALVIAGLTASPIATGQVTVHCRKHGYLMAVDVRGFTNILLTVREVASNVASVLLTNRCGLSYNGSGMISIIPLHGVGRDWRPIVHGEEEYHATFHSYLTSKSGPKSVDLVLQKTRDQVAQVPGITQPFNFTFDGYAVDMSILARIVRGELPQWRVRENNSHVAFLSPYWNTPGFTVVVSRKHLDSDTFALSDSEYFEIVQAAYTVAQHLREVFGVERCGMFFEGYEINYAHVKLVPVHHGLTSEGQTFKVFPEAATFQDLYPGYLTT